jgi:penicillin amidase
MEGFKWGSNALVVDGEHTETGQPMMFGGPQLGHFKPPAIYEVGLHGAGYDVVGFGVPGAPGVLIGRTPDFAWSVTSAREDMVDTIAIELDPNDKHRYRWKGEWHEMDCRTVTHNGSPVGDAIGGGDPRVVEQEVCRITEEGDEMTVIARNAEANVAWVQRTTIRDKLLTGAFEWVTLGRRNDRQGFEEALSDFSFSFNFLYADDEDIAYYHLADIPDRAPGPDFRLPRTDTGHEWLDGLVGLDLGTFVRNPSRGYVANWNNGPAKGWRAGDMPQNWGSIHRAEVLDRFVRKRLDDTGDSLALGDIGAILQSAATHDSVAFGPVPHMIEAARASSDPQLNAMADELEAWAETGYAWRDEDDDGRYDDPGHAIYDETMHELLERTFGDEFGDRFRSLDFEPPVTRHAADHGRADKMVTLVDALEGTTNRDWFDDAETAGDETRGEVLREALEAAADTLTEQFGSPLPSQWLLEEHTSKFMPIGAAKQNEIEMVNRGSWNQVVALDQPGLENSRGIIPPSNSGYISPEELATLQATGTEPDRLTDQLGRYRNFEYRPLPSTRAGVEAVTTTSQTLTIRDPNAGEDGPDEPVGSSENPPNDPDCDGKFEDVNGDGSFDTVDVQALFANRDGETVQNNPSAFDFNADGEFDVVDVQRLFGEVA